MLVDQIRQNMLKNKNFDVNEAFYNELDKGQKQYLVAQDVS